jgi:hypothetical protein
LQGGRAPADETECCIDETKRETLTVPDQQEMPEVAYHYTSMETLLKIMDSKSIWATNIRYLNDVLERQHCLSAVQERLPGAIRDTGLPLQDERLVETLLARFSENERAPFYELPFVASFSKDRDSLPQWRSYCHQGNGVCIGFRTDSLKKTSPATRIDVGGSERNTHVGTLTFDSVSYLKTEDTNAIDDLIHKTMGRSLSLMSRIRVENTSADPQPEQPIKVADFFWTLIDTKASRIKHPSFSSENEYRLIVTTFAGLAEHLCFRSSRSTLIPYIPLKFLCSNAVLKTSYPYFIDSVTVGPAPDLRLSADALEGYFLSRDLNVSVHKSKVPFRDL